MEEQDGAVARQGSPAPDESGPQKNKTVLHGKLRAAHPRRRLHGGTQAALHIRQRKPCPPAAWDAAERQKEVGSKPIKLSLTSRATARYRRLRRQAKRGGGRLVRGRRFRWPFSLGFNYTVRFISLAELMQLTPHCSTSRETNQDRQTRPRQRYAVGAIEATRTLIQRGVSVTFRWTPAHSGLEDNEIADVCAKAAAESTHHWRGQ